MLYTLGRFLQACGLILAPMALFYYFDNKGRTREFGLGTMEWMILGIAVLIFLLGRFLENRRPL
jgi:hypothetical protein